MGTTRTLGPSGNQVEVTWELEERTTIPSGRKFWTLKIKVCNKTGRKLDLAVAENPWRAPRHTEKMQYDKDGRGREVPGSDKKHALAGAKNMSLDVDECKTVEFSYDVQPGMAYTDIFERKADGTLPDDYTWGTIERLRPVHIASVPRRQNRMLAFAFPIPYQMIVDDLHDRQVWVAIDRIDVPDGFELAHSFPSVGATMRLERSERNSSAAVVLRQVTGLPEEARRTLTMWQRIVRPRALAEVPARPASLDLVNDVRPPQLDLRRFDGGDGGRTVVVEAVDGCAGVDVAELLVLHGDRHLCTVPHTRVESERGGAVKRFHFDAPPPPASAPQQLTVRVFDEVGNQAHLQLPEVRREPA